MSLGTRRKYLAEVNEWWKFETKQKKNFYKEKLFHFRLKRFSYLQQRQFQ